MSTQPFQASKLFGNSGTSESGWDDWDWVDNSNQVQSPNQNYVQTPPSPATMTVDNHQQQHIAPGYASSETNDLTQNIGVYSASQPFEQIQQQPQQQQPHHQQFSQFQQFQMPPKPQATAPALQPDANANSHSNISDEHFSTNHASSVNNNIAWGANGPFQPPPPLVSATNVSSYAATYTPPPPLVHSQAPSAVVDVRKASFDNTLVSQPAEPTPIIQETPLADPRINPHLSHISKEHQLTPQWSTESQMSYTSSDPSYGENDPHSRPFSNQSNGDLDIQRAAALLEHPNSASSPCTGYVEVDNYQNGDQGQVDFTAPAAVTTAIQQETDNFFNQNLAPPQEFAQPEPQSLPEQSPQVFNALAHAPRASLSGNGSPAPSSMAPPPSGVPLVPTIPITNTSAPLLPPSLNQSPYAHTNPFKRVGQLSHKSSPSPAVMFVTNTEVQPQLPPQMTSMPRPSTASTPASLHEPAHVDNVDVTSTDHSAIVPLHASMNSYEHAPHNDRNQYLQTGHLSEEGGSGHTIETSIHTEHPLDNAESTVDNLPPPGLSRYVLGEPEFNHSAPSNEPPPGLDRMIPGTDLTAPTTLNLERQADGEDTSSPTNVVPVRQVVHFSTLTQPESYGHVAHPINEHSVSDRNQYLVPGGSEEVPAIVATNPNIERVVTGLENDSSNSQHAPFVVEQLRDLDVDGENLDDDTAQTQARHVVHQQQPPAEREEPIEGANTLDIIQTAQLQPTPAAGNLTDADSIEALDTVGNTRKHHSNNSTGNDDSDKEKPAYNARGLSARRTEERPRKRGERNETRYETEDTDYSTRDRRKPRDNRDRNDRGDVERDRNRTKDRTDDEGRSYRRGERGDREEIERVDRGERSERGDRGDRDRYRDGDRERNDKYGRDRERGYRDDYRDSRYETDGSRYETEDSRFDRSLRRRGERDRDGKYREDRGDRRYRRGERDREGNFNSFPVSPCCHVNKIPRSIPDERYRSRDDPRYAEYESGDYSQRNRSHQKDRRRDRGAGSDREGGTMYSGYYPSQSQSGYNYDAYSSYMQQQQYYENLRRTNPHAYAEWYKHYFGGGQYQAAVAAAAADDRDGRESVHSGRSSSKDPERYATQSVQSLVPYKCSNQFEFPFNFVSSSFCV